MHTNNKKHKTTDLSAILVGLVKTNIEFILVGGLAAVAQGAPMTRKHYGSWMKNRHCQIIKTITYPSPAPQKGAVSISLSLDPSG
jgi:hypothetical protein